MFRLTDDVSCPRQSCFVLLGYGIEELAVLLLRHRTRLFVKEEDGKSLKWFKETPVELY